MYTMLFQCDLLLREQSDLRVLAYRNQAIVSRTQLLTAL